jgi:hypothetical protein
MEEICGVIALEAFSGEIRIQMVRSKDRGYEAPGTCQKKAPAEHRRGHMEVYGALNARRNSFAMSTSML